MFKRADKRRHVRVTPGAQHPVEVQIAGDEFLEVLSAVDISTGGVGIRVVHNFHGCNIQQQIDVIITLPHARSFSAKGIIRHKSGANSSGVFGVEFKSLSADAQTRLEHYVTLMVNRGHRC